MVRGYIKRWETSLLENYLDKRSVEYILENGLYGAEKVTEEGLHAKD